MNKTKGKGSKFRGNYRGKNKNSREREDRVPDSKKNDASWYTRNQALVADSGKIAFTWPAGIPVSLEIPNPNNLNLTVNYETGDNYQVPGIMALKYVPSYGAGHTGYDALNIAAQNVYTYVRHVQSGHANYDPNDLMLYLMAMDQIYSLYMHLVRAYGSIRLFSQKNRNFPRVLLNSMGFDYDDLAANLADFRYFINNAATRIGAMCVPNNMPLFVRHMWMTSGIYADGPSAKAQLYIFRQTAFGTYNEKTSTQGGFLEADFMDYVHTVAEWCTKLDSMIAAVRSSEDCGIISGDILKAYGDQVIKLPFITEDYMTNVVYSPEVLGQIANATVMPEAMYVKPTGWTPTPMFYQDLTDNVLKSSLKFRQTIASSENTDCMNMLLGKRVMIGLSESPTPEEVMVNSRLMVIAKDITNPTTTSLHIEPDSLGSEVVVSAAMYDVSNMEAAWNGGSAKMADYQYAGYAKTVAAYGGWGGGINAMAKSNYYNLHPFFALVNSTSNGNAIYTFFDVDNYAIVDAHDVAKMHETALLSMLDVPLLGSAK